MNSRQQKNKVSVVITTYNTSQYIEACLESVQKNTYQNLEIILMDDGSTDNTIEICKKIAEKDSRIRLIEQKNTGVSVARNNALAHITGDFVHFMDGDDYITYNFFDVLVSKIIEDNSDMVCCSYYNERRNFLLSPKPLLHMGIIGKLSVIEGWLFGASCMLFRKSFLLSNPELRFGTNIEFGEDILFLVKTTYFAKKVSAVPDAIYYHRHNENSITNKKKTLDQKIKRRHFAFLVGEIIDNFAKEAGINEKIWQEHKCKNSIKQMELYADVIKEFHDDLESNSEDTDYCKKKTFHTQARQYDYILHKPLIVRLGIKLLCCTIPHRCTRKKLRNNLLKRGNN